MVYMECGECGSKMDKDEAYSCMHDTCGNECPKVLCGLCWVAGAGVDDA